MRWKCGWFWSKILSDVDLFQINTNPVPENLTLMGLSLNELTRSREFMSEVLSLTFWSLPAGQWYSECYLVLSQAKVSRKAHGICQWSPLTFISQPYTFISQLVVILNTNHYVPILLSFPYNKFALLNIDPKTPNPHKLFPNRCTQRPQARNKKSYLLQGRQLIML